MKHDGGQQGPHRFIGIAGRTPRHAFREPLGRHCGQRRVDTGARGIPVALQVCEGSSVSRRTRRARKEMQQAADDAGLSACITGPGSLGQIHVCPASAPVTSYRAARRASRPLARLVHLALLNEGVFIAPRGMFAISTAMTPADVDTVVAALGEGAKLLAPAAAVDS